MVVISRMCESIDKNPDASQTDMDLEKLKCNIEIWKKVIDVQQHFNTIEMRIRNFAVTIMAGIIAAAGLALREPKDIIVFNSTISSASAVLFAGIVILLSFYFMDRFWYHRLLQGAVSRGEALETEIQKTLPEIVLSKTIREISPIRGIRSDRKIDIFYGIIIAFLLVTACGVTFFGGNASDRTAANEATCAGYFNISLKGEMPNTIENNAISGYGILEIKGNKNKSDLETIFKYI